MARDLGVDDRDLGPDDRDPVPDIGRTPSSVETPDAGRGAADSPRERPADRSDERDVEPNRDRHDGRDRSERRLLQEVGMFRTVRVADLERLAYAGQSTECARDLRSLARRGLVKTHTLIDPHRPGTQTLVTLTREGLRTARGAVTRPDQSLYEGLVKRRELRHDAAVYRMYHAEAARIAHAGGRVQRVIVDDELKRLVSRAMNDPRNAATDPDTRRHQIVQQHGLPVVSGTVQIPDLRLEYEITAGDLARVDLELVTEHYRPGPLAAKAQAGFTLYAPAAHVDRLRAVLEERDLMVEILSL